MTDKYTIEDAEMIMTSAGPWYQSIMSEHYIHLDHVIWLMNYAHREALEDGKDIGIAEERLKNPTTRANIKDME